MTVSSSTPGGWPGRCVLCGADFQVEFSDPGNDATCPNCGHLMIESADLLNKYRSYFQRAQESSVFKIDTPLEDLSMDCDALKNIEFVMQLEEEFGVSISEDEASSIHTVGDAIRYILEYRRRQIET